MAAQRARAMRRHNERKDDPDYKRRAAEKTAIWYRANKKKAVAASVRRRRERIKTDLSYKIECRIRNRLGQAIKHRYRKSAAILDLGCTIDELISHLEGLFQPGMTWGNWCRAGWHIDHVKPLSSFDLTDPAQVAEACHFSNLAPLWAKENIAKGSRHPGKPRPEDWPTNYQTAMTTCGGSRSV